MWTPNYQSRADSEREQALRRRLTGVGTTAIWYRLVYRIGGEIVDEGGPAEMVRVPVGPWVISFDAIGEMCGEGHDHFTQVRASYVARDEFRFRIDRRGVLTRVAQWLGTETVPVAHPDFDAAFSVETNDAARARRLLDVDPIRALIQAQREIVLQIRGNESTACRHLRDDEAELSFRSGGIVEDAERLRDLYELFARTLHELRVMGCAAG